MKPPLMAICSRSSTTRAGWLATTPSWLFPQALLAPLFILAAGSEREDEEGPLMNSLTLIHHLPQPGWLPISQIYKESLGFEVLQHIYQYVAWSADTKVLFGFMHPAHKYMVGTRLTQARHSRHGLVGRLGLVGTGSFCCYTKVMYVMLYLVGI